MRSEPDPGEFRRRLLSWFGENARDLPWRRSDDPYAIWVSEIMLQQTRVAAVLDHYGRFMRRFPTVQDLAAATEDEVLAQWSGLGYYRRARLLHLAAQVVAGTMEGRIPETAAELRALPGVGEYTSAAIASIGFGEAAACVDGNVERVLRRVRGWHEDSGARAKIRAEAARLLDPAHPGDFNQAMMELGATVCLPRSPLCLQCPVCEMCATRGEHPARARNPMRSKQSAYGFLLRTRNRTAEVLLERRPADASLMPGMWELPGIDSKAAPEDMKILSVRHSITDTNYSVSIYGLNPKQLRALSGRKAVRRWFPVGELPALPLTGLTRKVLKRLRTWPEIDVANPAVASPEARTASRSRKRAMAALVLIAALLLTWPAFAQTTPALHSRGHDSQQDETQAAKGVSTLPDNASGEFILDSHGSVVQITIERNRLTGYVTLMQQDTALTLFFDKTSIHGNRVAFTTKTVHDLRFSFTGAIVQGHAEAPALTGYYRLAGKLTTYRDGTPETKWVNMKSTPRL